MLEAELGINMGDNTPDASLGLHLAQCNGTCEQAPQIWVDGSVVGPLDAVKTRALVRDLKAQSQAPAGEV
jgi:NADH:ubiquinone oxidoreductase subunit E